MTKKEKIASVAFIVNAVFFLAILTSLLVQIQSSKTYVLNLEDIKPTFSNSSSERVDL